MIKKELNAKDLFTGNQLTERIITYNKEIIKIKEENPDIFPRLSPADEKKAYLIFNYLGRNENPINGNQIAAFLGIDPIELRCLIAKIRREMTIFQNPTGKFVLMANPNGYWISDNREDISKYLEELRVRYLSTKLQFLEAKIISTNLLKGGE